MQICYEYDKSIEHGRMPPPYFVYTPPYSIQKRYSLPIQLLSYSEDRWYEMKKRKIYELEDLSPDVKEKIRRYEKFYGIEKKVAQVFKDENLDPIECIWLLEDMKLTIYSALFKSKDETKDILNDTGNRTTNTTATSSSYL